MAFQIAGNGVASAVTTSSVATPLPKLPNGSIPNFVVLSNTLSIWVYFKFGDSNVVATITNSPLIPINRTGLLIATAGATHIANITDSSTSNLIITPVYA